MPWIAIAGSVVGGLLSADAADSASDAQLGATREATAEQKRQFDLTRQDFAPWRNVGQSGLYKLADLLGIPGNPANQGHFTMAQPSRAQFTSMQPGKTKMQVYDSYGNVKGAHAPQTEVFDQAGYDAAMANYNNSYVQDSTPEGYGSLLKPFTGADLQNEPGYQFGLGQGTEMLNSQASAAGRRLSPATMKALQRFGQDYAGTKYGEAFNRDQVNKNQVFNMLSGVSGTGQTATAQTASSGANMVNNVSDLITQGGNARAAGIMGRANAFSSGLQNAGNAYSGYQTMNRFMNSGYGGGINTSGWRASSNPNEGY